MNHVSLRHRFPGIQDGWARFDGPAGTQMVDVSIQAVADWMSGPDYACGGGFFAASQASSDLVDRARVTVGQLLGADPNGVTFGPNMTSLTFSISRAIAATLKPGDRIIGTRLDHDANITPWKLAADSAGADHILASFDPATGMMPVEHVIDLIDERTKWVTLPGASNLLGTVPDHGPIIEAAHAAGARVFIDAVAWAPHVPLDIAALGCDALVTSPYKWYGPHSGVMWMQPDLLQSLPVLKVRPSYDEGPSRFETGMTNFEALAGVDAAARFLLDQGLNQIAAYEMELFAPLLDGLKSIPGVVVYGSHTLDHRTPTAAFTIAGVSPAEAARAMADDKIAVWDGHNYAIEVVDQLGLADTGGVIRAGLSRYSEPDDVQRLLKTTERLATLGR